MKKVFIVILGLAAASSANAKSLEEYFASQSQIVISPLSLGGKSVETDTLDAETEGAYVCSSLGYTRLVQAESEPCVQGEEMIVLSASFSSAVVVSDRGSCGRDGTKRLKSVSCAR